MIHRLKQYLEARRFRFPVLAAVAVVFLFTGLITASAFQLTGSSEAVSTNTALSGGLPASFADLAQKLGPSVVNIKVVKIEKIDFPGQMPFDEGPFGDLFKRFFRDMPRQRDGFRSQGAGSGVIISTDGHILTNNHVVEGAKEVVVTMSDKKEHKATVIGRDPKTDLAVVKINPAGRLVAATLGDSEQLRVGDWVLAIGNPFGLSNTVTSGIVSAKGRIIGAGPYDDFIQTDAPINPGNSGGPLINMKGEVVGINTAIIPYGQGIGFAIPVNTAKPLIPQLVSKGSVTRGWLGVNIQNVSPDLAKAMGLKDEKGALVSDVVPGSPAEKAGVKRGDVITGYNGKEVKDSHELPALVAATPVGSDATLTVLRDGNALKIPLKIAKMDSEKAKTELAHAPAQGKWGLQLTDLTPELARRLGVRAERGAVVANVVPGSPAEQASLQRGDVILEVNRQPVRNVDDVRNKLSKAQEEGSVMLLVQRDKGNFYVVLNG